MAEGQQQDRAAAEAERQEAASEYQTTKVSH